MQANPRETSISDIIAVLYRNKGKALVVFACIFLGGLVYIAIAPRTYRSQGRLYLRLGRENATLDPITTMRSDPVVVVPQSRESELNSAVDILQTRLMAEQVVEELGPEVILGNKPLDGDASPSGGSSSKLLVVDDVKRGLRNLMKATGLSDHLEPREIAILEVANGLMISRKRDSNVIDVAYDSENPKLSQAVVNRLMNQFVELHIKMNRPEGARSFLNEQKEQLLVKLTTAEESVRNLKEETGLVSPREQRHALVAQIAGLEDDLRKTQAELTSVEGEIRSLEGILQDLPEKHVTMLTDGLSNEGTDGIRQQFYALQVKERELSAKFSDSHPALRAVREQLSEAEGLLKEEAPSRQHVTMGINREHEELKLTLLKHRPTQIALKSKVVALERQLAEVVQKLNELSVNELHLSRAERNYEVQDSDYRNYVSAVEQARIEEALSTERISNIQIAQPATLETKPIKPQKPLTAALSLVMATAGGFLAAFGFELRKRALTS